MNGDGWGKSYRSIYIEYIYVCVCVCAVTKLSKDNQRSMMRFLTLERQSLTHDKLLDTWLLCSDKCVSIMTVTD